MHLADAAHAIHDVSRSIQLSAPSATENRQAKQGRNHHGSCTTTSVAGAQGAGTAGAVAIVVSGGPTTAGVAAAS
jgi:hypothetical protein